MHPSNTAAKVIFTAIAIVLLAISYVLYQQIHSLLSAQDQLNETNIVKLKVEQTLSSLKDAESAQRGFLLSKDSVFLQPYYGAYNKSKTLVREIRDLIRSTDQQKDLVALQGFIELRFKTFNHVIEHYNNPNLRPDTKQMYLLMSKYVMDSISVYSQNINAREDHLLKEREISKRKYSFLTPFFAILLMVTAIAVLVFSYGKIIEQLNRLKKIFSEMKTLNNELKQKNYKLELYNKELDSFTYIASHDLKEPIRKILTYSDQMEIESHENFTESNRKQLNRIKHSAQRMQNLLNDLLLYSHVNISDKTFEEVDLNKIVNDVICNLNEEITETHAQIKTERLPVIKGMPFQIKQLFENLIGNSIKYKQDHVPPAITIGGSIVDEKDISEKFYKESNQYYKLFVSDNGLGFEQIYSEKIFKLFQRFHSSDKPGTGIGLTICKKIVDNHNGFIKASSEVNRGTTFEIYFPLN
ncbi:MAG TPA: CHASE3 domain-containing protein [Flavisolibacter sp.]|jgi:signal transduction histidine kinase|nr:CHASE3 domain-containing protein [Flavisolibacter sp.]